MTFLQKTQTHENLSQVFLEAPRSDFVHLSSKMTFLQKSTNHEMLSSALQKTVHFIRNNNFSCS